LTDAVVLADASRLPHGPVWGAPGGSASPERDEALDWLTLVRLLGWNATVAGHEQEGALADHDVAILTGRPEDLPLQLRSELLEAAQGRQMLVVAAPSLDAGWKRFAGAARGAGAGPPAEDGRLSWEGPGPHASWTPGVPLSAEPLDVEDDLEVWASLGGRPVIAARRLPGGSVIATVALDPSRARAASGAATALLKRLLTCGCPFATAWLDLEGALVLRMDDPGSSANVHLRSWSYAKLGEPEWAAVGAALRSRGARLSVAYTPGWVDDGDAERGTLEVGGEPVERRGGAVHPSPLVVHTDRKGNAPGRVNDYRAEFRGITNLQRAGLVGVELHGYTHLASDLRAWSQAPDRYDEVAWYREFDAGPQPPAGAADHDHPVHLGARLLEKHFRHAPTTLVCPGQAWTELALEQALAAGLRLVSAEGLALRDRDRFCWCAGIPSVYLDKPDPSHLVSELPVIGLFHDYELATAGVDWMPAHLDAWRRAGARRFIDFRELAAALDMRLSLSRDADASLRLRSRTARGLAPPRPVPVLMHIPGGEPPPELRLELGGACGQAKVQRLGGGLGRLVLPPADPRRAGE